MSKTFFVLTYETPGPEIRIEMAALPDTLNEAIAHAKKIILKGKDFLGLYEIKYKNLEIKKDWTNEVKEKFS